MREDYYSLLGLTRQATEGQIRRAYRRQVLKYHPDRNPGNDTAVEMFRKMTEAYEVLSRPDAREAYDSQLKPLTAHVTEAKVTKPSPAAYKPPVSQDPKRGKRFSVKNPRRFEGYGVLRPEDAIGGALLAMPSVILLGHWFVLSIEEWNREQFGMHVVLPSLLVAMISSALGGAIGSSFARAFVSESETWLGKSFGTSIAVFVSGLVGGITAAFLSLFGIGLSFQSRYFDGMFLMVFGSLLACTFQTVWSARKVPPSL